ncbi:MAG: hypothetical protein GX205_01200 [Firmicutes bacterium]|nr:hypothetical protein [Bacillota bacterium]
MIQVGIIGAGHGGTALLDMMLHSHGLSIIGIADPNPNSPGIRLARSRGIFATSDFHDLVAMPGKKVLIDATGVAAVAAELNRLVNDDLSVITTQAAELLWSMIDEREKVMEVLMNESTRLLSSVQHGTVQLEELNAQYEAALQETAQRTESLAELTANSHQLLQKTEEIMEIIRKVADQTRILGINAAIESARAGEHGRGFSVVADAIHNLSAQSVKSVQSVGGTIQDIYAALSAIANQVNLVVADIRDLEEKQHRITQELHASLQTMSKSAQSLRELSKKAEHEKR